MSKKKMLAVVMAAAIMVGLVNPLGTSLASAEWVSGVTTDGFRYEFSSYGTECSVVGYEGDAATVTIPQTIKGKKVTSICIMNNVAIKKLIIPANVEKIESTTSEEEGTGGYFEACENLSEIEVDKDNPKFSSSDGMLLSKDMSLLYAILPGKTGTVTIPSYVKKLYSYVFNGANKITSFSVAAGNQTFESDNGVLYSKGCLKLLAYPKNRQDTQFTVNENCISIGDEAISRTKYLQKVTLGKRVSVIDFYAFYHCDNLKEVVTTKGLIEIGTGAFSNCTNLSKINLCDGLVELGNQCFLSCDSLKTLDMPKTLYKIGEECLDLYNMKSLTVRSSYTKLDLSDMVRKSFKIAISPKHPQYKAFKKRCKVTKIKDTGLVKSAKTKAIKTKKSVNKGTGKPTTKWYKKKAKKLYITSPDQLAGISKLLSKGYSFRGQRVILKKSIDLVKYKNWKPIDAYTNDEYSLLDSFSGTFDGNNKKIYNLTINRPQTDSVGLFGTLYRPAKVLNVKLVNVNITGRQNVGGIAGWFAGTLDQCSIRGNVSGMANVGGAAGNRDSDVRFTRCTNYAHVKAIMNAGGIIGYSASLAGKKMMNCFNKGKVSAYYMAGGIFGDVCFDGNSSILNCQNTGAISARKFVGGIAGYGCSYLGEGEYGQYTDRGFISCVNKGKIKETMPCNTSGGIAGATNYAMEKCKSTTISRLWGVILL